MSSRPAKAQAKPKAPDKETRSKTIPRGLVAIGVLLAFVLSLGLCGLRRTEWFSERIELPLYDLQVLITDPWPSAREDIVLVTLQDPKSGEEQIRPPLDDETLYRSMVAILEGNPSVLGIAMVAAADGSTWTSPKLRKLFHEQSENIVASFTLPRGGQSGFRPPPFAANVANEKLRIAFTDFPTDIESGRNRRGYISATYKDPGGKEVERFSFAVACAILHAQFSRNEDALIAMTSSLHGKPLLQPRTGAYALEAGEGLGSQFLLKPVPGFADYFDAPSRHYSLSTVLGMSRDAKTAAFENKIVLLGNYHLEPQKARTPVAGNPDLPAIKLQALAITQILREEWEGERPLTSVPDLWEDLSVIAAGLLTALAVLSGASSSSWRPLLITAGIACGVVAIGAVLLGAGYWIPAGAPALGSFLSGISCLALEFAAARRTGDEAYGLFAKKFGTALADRLWENRKLILSGGRIPSESFTGTAFFIDLAGYTPAARALQSSGDDQAFQRWIGDYMQTMIGLVIDHGGLVKDVEGDAIMAVFGFPPTAEFPHAAAAVRCALAMQKAVTALNAGRDPNIPAYRFRIGIYTGSILAIQQGSRSQFEYALTGNAVNCAKRLEQFRKDQFTGESRILAGSATRDQADDSACFTAVDDQPVQIDKSLQPEIIWTCSSFST